MKRTGLFTLFVLITAAVFGQNPKAVVTFERNPVGLKERIYLYIDIDAVEAGETTVAKSNWPAGITYLAGPTIKTVVVTYDEEMPRKTRVRKNCMVMPMSISVATPKINS